MSRFPDHRNSRADRRDPPRHRGHRRELAGRDREPRRPFQDRLQASLVDVAIHRAVASRDIVQQQFGGHPFAGRRGIDSLKKSGLVEEHELRSTSGPATRVLTATPAGRRLAGQVAPARGWSSDQRTWAGLGKAADLKHDLALYRAVALARAQLEERGFHVRRLRLDAEMRSLVAKRVEAVRARDGRAEAEALRRQLAAHLNLPLDETTGGVLYPDAQLEYAREADGPIEGRVNIEITTENYSKASIAAKSAAGFALYPSGAKAGRHLNSTLGSLSGGRRGGLSSPTGTAGDAAAGGGRRGGFEDDLLDL